MKVFFKAAFLGSACLAFVATMPALAEPVPVPVRGAVQSFAPGNLTVLSRNGEALSIAIPQNVQVVSILPRALGDIKVGDAVSTTAVPDGQGGLTALQVSILPAVAAGGPQGQRPWDAAPDSVMTNATISGIASEASDHAITMTYGDKTVTMDVPESVPVVAFGQGDSSLLSTGAEVFLVAMRDEGGSLSADRVIAETNGVKPPM